MQRLDGDAAELGKFSNSEHDWSPEAREVGGSCKRRVKGRGNLAQALQTSVTCK